MMYEIPTIGMQLNRLPINIIFAETGEIAFTRRQRFDTIVSYEEDGLQCIMDDVGLFIGANTEIMYDVFDTYKDKPELLAWLVAQKMEPPVFPKLSPQGFGFAF